MSKFNVVAKSQSPKSGADLQLLCLIWMAISFQSQSPKSGADLQRTATEIAEASLKVSQSPKSGADLQRKRTWLKEHSTCLNPLKAGLICNKKYS